MTRDFRPLSRAFFLLVGCTAFRLWSSLHPDLLPNISPLIAVSLVGAMVLPAAWGWLVGPLSLILTELAFVGVNLQTEGTAFSSGTLLFVAFYAAVGGLGGWLARHKSVLNLVLGTVGSSLLFYVLGNTTAWWGNSNPAIVPSYSPDFAGWWQANTIGLPGWAPSWTFFRNGLLGDLAFAFALVLLLDRAWLASRATSRIAARA